MSASPNTRLIADCAHTLCAAETGRRPIEPLTDQFKELSVADAYAIQRLNVARRIQGGERIVGHKIGLTAIAMQELFGVHEPDYGHLLNTMVHDAAVPLDLSELIDPQIEVEPAFVLGKDLRGPELTGEDVLAATDHICTCFEIIDSRIAGWRIRVQDTVADNGSSARVVLGTKKVLPRALQLDTLDTTLEIDGAVVERGHTSAILGHPANGVAWLANKLAEFDVTLRAGDIVLPGTCTKSRRAAGHRRAVGAITGLGTVSLQLINTPSVIHTS